MDPFDIVLIAAIALVWGTVLASIWYTRQAARGAREEQGLRVLRACRPDGKTHQADGWTNYSTFSLWDTYRASHPLFTYIQPKRANDMIQCFLHFYEQSGALPLWNLYGWETNMMIGYHAVPVIVDAYLKGIGNFDAEKALEACIASANRDDYHGIGFYKEHGYVPRDKENWSMSKTMEYAYDDYCIARMAEAMGKQDIAQEYYERAKNYRNVFNPETSFMQPRDSKGDFIPDYDPEEYIEDICESNGWQYYWAVQHDVDGLIELTGGEERFAQRLDSMFTFEPRTRTSCRLLVQPHQTALENPKICRTNHAYPLHQCPGWYLRK